MLSKALIAVFISGAIGVSGQMIESVSRPYRFDINKMITVEGYSDPHTVTIQSHRSLIKEELENSISSWYKVEGYKYSGSPDFQYEVLKELEAIQPEVINRVGIKVMQSCQPEYFFVPEILQFEIVFNGFEHVKLSVPIHAVENFKLNFEKLSFRDQRISFNQLDHFVILEMNIYDPESGISYHVESTDSNLNPPSFSISLPGDDF